MDELFTLFKEITEEYLEIQQEEGYYSLIDAVTRVLEERGHTVLLREDYQHLVQFYVPPTDY